MEVGAAAARFDRRRLLIGGGAAVLGLGLEGRAAIPIHAQGGSPEAGGSASGDGMAALLWITPQLPPLAAEGMAFLTYADLVAQYAAVGTNAPERGTPSPFDQVKNNFATAVAERQQLPPDDPTIVVARIMPLGARLNDWYSLYISRDLGFLAW